MMRRYRVVILPYLLEIFVCLFAYPFMVLIDGEVGRPGLGSHGRRKSGPGFFVVVFLPDVPNDSNEKHGIR